MSHYLALNLYPLTITWLYLKMIDCYDYFLVCLGKEGYNDKNYNQF